MRQSLFLFGLVEFDSIKCVTYCQICFHKMMSAAGAQFVLIVVVDVVDFDVVVAQFCQNLNNVISFVRFVCFLAIASCLCDEKKLSKCL